MEPAHRPIVDARIAMVCSKCMRREFLDSPDATWACPEHGRGPTQRQKNRPYLGQPTTRAK